MSRPLRATGCPIFDDSGASFISNGLFVVMFTYKRIVVLKSMPYNIIIWTCLG